MAKLLEQYQTRKEELCSQIKENDLSLDALLVLQEINYRICVLEAFKFYKLTAPITLDTNLMSPHFQMLDSFIRFLTAERKFGFKTDEAGQRKRVTATDALVQVIQDCRKRFNSFNATSQEQYKTSVQTMIKTVLPVWLQYRNSYVNL